MAELPTFAELFDVPTAFGSVRVYKFGGIDAAGAPVVPEGWRRRFLRWVTGGSAVDDSVPEAQMIEAAMVGFVFRLPNPKLLTDDQLRGLDMPVLAFLGGRSVMVNAARAAAKARKMLQFGQIELLADATHAINGEYHDVIAERAHRFWDAADAAS